ncbi:MAG TPA: adenosylcobinamide-GDP ribazoletransferase [Thermoanaerobaculia bacterium]
MKGRIIQEGRLFWTALTLLTRLPAPHLAEFQEEWLARSAAYFPLVGLIVGLLAAAVYFLADLLWSSPVPAILALAAVAWVTGGLHEDGWADVFDGFAASRDRERILAVMKDSRIGSSGAFALILLVFGKLAALATLPLTRALAALVAAHILSRWSSLPLMWGMPYARPEGGMALPLVGRVSGGRLAAGTVVAGLITVPILRWAAIPALIAALVAVIAPGLVFRRRLGGITGDCLGTANQLVELSVLLALAAHPRLAP